MSLDRLSMNSAPSKDGRDGFEDFYGYSEATLDMPDRDLATEEFAGSFSLQESFAQFYLPDLDPSSHLPGLMDATQASLAALRTEIEERRALLAQQGPAHEKIRREIHALKLQQTRLLGALWSLEVEQGEQEESVPMIKLHEFLEGTHA